MSSPHDGQLSCGLNYVIEPSRKKSIGLNEGMHFIAVIKDSELSIPELPSGALQELWEVAQNFAEHHATTPGAYRIAYNGPSVGRRIHAHIHIMLPSVNDKLPNLVDINSQ